MHGQRRRAPLLWVVVADVISFWSGKRWSQSHLRYVCCMLLGYRSPNRWAFWPVVFCVPTSPARTRPPPRPSRRLLCIAYGRGLPGGNREWGRFLLCLNNVDSRQIGLNLTSDRNRSESETARWLKELAISGCRLLDGRLRPGALRLPAGSPRLRSAVTPSKRSGRLRGEAP